MDFITRLLKLAAKEDLHWVIYWNEDLQFCVNCNDFFWWGCADSEDITKETLKDLEKAIKEAGPHDGTLLYCARMRRMRPQGAAYHLIHQKNWPLFDACGPVRKAEFGNPEERPFPITK